MSYIACTCHLYLVSAGTLPEVQGVTYKKLNIIHFPVISTRLS